MVSVLASRAGIFAARKITASDKVIAVWKGIVGVWPMKTPMPTPFAKVEGSPFNLIKRRYRYFKARCS